ncbi:MAG: ISAs1 family transposase [Streptococcaceae bacterium]|jgi:predicted transposase YbfD/YdcC|nr:ISAs1 family transposase [Streptococcaceae bacterium]
MLKYFENIQDPRQAWKVKHNLLEIVVMVICAVVAECEAWYQIDHYCQLWFKQKLKLKLENGIPSHDTMQRVFELIDPNELEASFRSLILDVAGSPKSGTVSIDGKTIKSSKTDDKKAAYMVSAWSSNLGLVIGQVKTCEKSNEIKAVPELLNLLDVRGCTVTADAMSCQKEIVKKVTQRGADYCIALKQNQKNLFEDVSFYFSDIQNLKATKTFEKGHGRLETREYFLETNIDWLHKKDEWKNLNGISMVRSTILKKRIEKQEVRYFLTSLLDVKKFAKSLREHWVIENNLHLVLDVAFREDYNKTNKGNSAENFAITRHIALNLIRRDTSKMSVRGKRHRYAYDNKFLYKILFESF